MTTIRLGKSDDPPKTSFRNGPDAWADECFIVARDHGRGTSTWTCTCRHCRWRRVSDEFRNGPAT